MSIELYNHPDYQQCIEKWKKYRAFHDGDLDTLKRDYLVPHDLETKAGGDKLLERRMSRTYYTNFIEPIIGIYTDLLFSKAPSMAEVEKNERLSMLLDNVDGRGKTLIRFLKSVVAKNYFLYGQPYILIDAPKVAIDGEMTEQRKQESGHRPYMIGLSPIEVTDWDIEENDPKRAGKYNALIYEFEKVEPRESLSEEPKVRLYRKELKREGGQIVTQLYREIDEKEQKNRVDPGEYSRTTWEVDQAGGYSLDELPLVTIFDNASWVKDSTLQADKHFNLESMLDNQLHYQAMDRVFILSDGVNADDSKKISETIYTIIADSSAKVTNIAPSYPQALFERLAGVETKIFKIALNQLRVLSGDSKAAQSGDTLREEKEPLMELMRGAAVDMQEITNEAVSLFHKFDTGQDFHAQIEFSTEFTEEDITAIEDRLFKLRDRLSNLPKFERALMKKLAENSDLSEEDQAEVLAEIENMQNGASGANPQIADRVSEIFGSNGDS